MSIKNQLKEKQRHTKNQDQEKKTQVRYIKNKNRILLQL